MSSRTYYRVRRMSLRYQIAMLTHDILTLNTLQLEKIPLKLFKETEKNLRDMLKAVKTS